MPVSIQSRPWAVVPPIASKFDSWHREKARCPVTLASHYTELIRRDGEETKPNDAYL